MSAYYYAAGRKVAIERDPDQVAVDQLAAERAGVGTEVRTATADGPRQVRGVLLARRSALGKDTLATLQKAGALQPVYKQARSVMVALPEIRIEFDGPDQRQAVMDLLAGTGSLGHTVTEESSDRITLRPASGRGEDALTMANDIYERAHPAAASVRFVQFVPKTTLA